MGISIKKHGIEEVERLEMLRHIPKKITDSEFGAFVVKFTLKFASLMNGNSEI